MELTAEELKVAEQAAKIGAEKISTKSWKAKARGLAVGFAQKTKTNFQDLEFILTVVISGRGNYFEYDQGTVYEDAIPLRDKLRGFLYV